MENPLKRTKLKEIEENIFTLIASQGGTGLPIILDILSYLSVPEIATLSTRGGIREYLEGFREDENGVKTWHKEYEMYYMIAVRKHRQTFVDDTATMFLENDVVPKGKRVNFLWLMLAKWGVDKIRHSEKPKKVYKTSSLRISFAFLRDALAMNNNDILGRLVVYEESIIRPGDDNIIDRTLHIRISEMVTTTLPERDYMKTALFSFAAKEGFNAVTYIGQMQISFRIESTPQLIMRMVYRFLTLPRVFIDFDGYSLMRSELN